MKRFDRNAWAREASDDPGAGVGAGGPAGPEAVELGEDELDLLRLLADGASLDQAADRLHLSRRTVSRRLTELCARLDVDKPIEAVVWAVRHGAI